MTVTPGTPFTFDSNNAQTITIAQLSSTKSITLFIDTTAAPDEIVSRVIESDENVGAAFTVTNDASFETAIAGLTSTKAIALYDDFTGSIPFAKILNISGTTITSPGAAVDLGSSGGAKSIVALSSSAAIAIHDDSAGIANYLTVSGNTITDESNVTFEAGVTEWSSSAALSATKALAIYTDQSDGNKPKVVVLSISGTTISAGTPVNVDGDDASGSVKVAPISSSRVLACWNNTTDTDLKCATIDISGTVPTVNTAAIIEGSDTIAGEIGLTGFTATEFVVTFENQTSADSEMAQIDVSGTTVTPQAPVQLSTTQGVNHNVIAFNSTLAIDTYSGTGDAVLITLSADALGLAAMVKPASLSADGSHIYVALLQGGTPIITKISTVLDADGSTVFDPGAGDNIGVQCGKFDADIVWVAGNFGGTDTVEKSEDAGTSFDVKDPGTFDPVTSFVVGPDSDDRVLVFADAGASVASSSIQETIDSGASWEEKNSGLGFVSKAVERLDVNVEEIVTGNEAGASDNIHYSVNTGEDLEDYSTGFPTQDVTKVIVG